MAKKDHSGKGDCPQEVLLQQITALQAECMRLRKENEELRNIASLSGGSVQPSPLPAVETKVPPEFLPEAESNFSRQEQIALFRSLFRGREDVYAVLWINEWSGKIGYSPAVRGAFKEKPKEYLPLTDQVIQEHLFGTKTIGVYPLLTDDTCWFLACDFDGARWAENAVTYLAACERHGLPAYLERSRSGNGGHVWIFFAERVPAISARRLAAFLLRETMAIRGDLDLTAYDRCFPNQDYLPKGGFGNLIALPLQKKCRALGNTEFLNPATMHPWPDQWLFLSQVQRLSANQVALLSKKIPSVTVATAPTEGIHKPPYYGEVTPRISCALEALLRIEKAGIPSALLAEIKHLASFHNPIYYERQKLRLSTHRTPRFIQCYEQDETYLYLPRGVIEKLMGVAKAAGTQLAVVDRRPLLGKIPLVFRGTLSPLQEEAVKAVLGHDHGVLVAPPGAGKTPMGCYVAASRGVPTLILVHRKPLLEQWRVQLLNNLGLSPEEIGQIGSGKDKRTCLIDLAMIQSLKNMEDLDSFFSRYGLIIVDECHHIPAFSFESCMKKAPARYILGLTATPYRRDGLEEIITMQCGPIRYSISPRSGIQGDLTLELEVRETPFSCETNEDLPIQDLFRTLVHDPQRSTIICQDISAALGEGRRCLVLSQWKEHCQLLAEQLLLQGKKPLVLDGTIRKKARAAIVEAIQHMPSGEDLLVIATGQYLGEGFDCPQLDTLFLVFPVAFKGKLIQYSGRLMRAFEGKHTVRVYDYVDVQVPVLNKMYAKRLKTYERLGFVSLTKKGEKRGLISKPRGSDPRSTPPKSASPRMIQMSLADCYKKNGQMQ